MIGAGDAFARPLRGVLTAIAILVGVATLVFASGLHSSITRFNDLFGPALNGPYQVSVARLGSYSDAATMEILERQPETRLVVGTRQLQVAVPGEPDPVAATVYRGDSARLGYHIASGRWFAGPGEAVLGTTFNPYHWTIGQVVDLRIEGEPAPVRIVGACYCFFNLATDWSTHSSSLPNGQPTGYLVQLQ